jgi:hypothetical protein
MITRLKFEFVMRYKIVLRDNLTDLGFFDLTSDGIYLWGGMRCMYYDTSELNTLIIDGVDEL